MCGVLQWAVEIGVGAQASSLASHAISGRLLAASTCGNKIVLVETIEEEEKRPQVWGQRKSNDPEEDDKRRSMLEG